MNERIVDKFNALYHGYSAYHQLSVDCRGGLSSQRQEARALEENRELYAHYVHRLHRLQERIQRVMDNGQAVGDSHLAVLNTAEMNAIEAELDGLVGRLNVEVKAIIGFARLASGDIFEVSVKHGSQKWKTRGKTQPDRAQRWDSPGHNFTCYPDHPIMVKVTEVRLIRSVKLAEKSFDPTKFFSPQPQLVTMNLNSLGSLKLQMVVSWLPLMTSKNMNQQPNYGAPQFNPVNRSLSLAMTRNGSVDNGNEKAGEPPIKVCLREKKRGRSQQLKDQKNWRSSTTILDSVYKDLSKSIPAIDDLTGLTDKYHHKYNQSEGLPNRTSTYNTRQPKPHLGTYMLTKQGLEEENWARSISMHHLATNEHKNKQEGGTMSRPATSMTDSDDSSGVSSMTSQKQSCRVADNILDLMDKVRAALVPLRCQEYAELATFESCMLNWEALVKLNRAVLLEQSRSCSRRSTGNLNRLNKRASMYHIQHSPSTLSDELDEPLPVFENDSGIDSLRQNTSPYNHRQEGSFGGTASRGPAQRRFKQFKERRKSLGIVLDNEYDRFFGAYNEGALLSRQPSTVGSSPDSHRKESTATGNHELDLCLEHHTKQALDLLSDLQKQKGPFEYQLGLLLNQIEQTTLALDEMLKIADQLPNPINVVMLLRELGATTDQQDVWISTARAVQGTIMVPAERLRMNLISFMTPIVENCYPKLVERVADSLMDLMGNKITESDNMVSVFEFTSLFQGKLMGPFVENLAHEAFITSSLESNNINLVRDVMDRLRKVPIVPPLESLRFVGKVLLSENRDCCIAVERYLNYASDGLRNDLAGSFCSLLEHRQPESRMGACRALAVLKLDSTIELLDIVAKQDEDQQVRSEARRSMESIQRFFGDYQEITKI
ncbi:unnamed protein product [Bursaphelenchus xylophilus]|uniref:(pine wood nematode) hypothetical protein n=1 Tax=Bursaphelenchus xylophilus TaxID=6326 RepID=A0A1I7S529_BURXY|nr:unnamed protein product [Bursaphelenchus xylophilus]CAG9117639.1 unnamed protein product [Bursaphelenchus xylophilus]